MAGNDASQPNLWSSRLMFVLAAAGSAVGLGNIWKFPYIAGENGGGAFVVVYLICIAAIGVPIMAAEVLLGRAGRQSPINTLRTLVQRSGASKGWTLIGWVGVLGGFLILSFYAVIAGWALHYIFEAGSGTFTGASSVEVSGVFDDFLASPWTMLFWHTVFMAGTVAIVARGVNRGLEFAVRWFMPVLFVLILLLVGYAMVVGDFAAGFGFLFGFDFEALTVAGVQEAMGHAFFTLSIGMGAIMAYGAYVPSNVSIPGTVLTIAGVDTVVALAAGLAIFPIVFANPGLEAGAGPGLLFVTLPIAFGSLPLGAFVGTLFFILISFAAITSAISIVEPALAWMVEQFGVTRSRMAIALGAICWVLGIGSVLSFNIWSDVHIVGERTFFDFVDYVTQVWMLPIGGFLIALFAAWVLPKEVVTEQLGFSSGFKWKLWLVLGRVVAPIGVLTVFVYTTFLA